MYEVLPPIVGESDAALMLQVVEEFLPLDGYVADQIAEFDEAGASNGVSELLARRALEVLKLVLRMPDGTAENLQRRVPAASWPRLLRIATASRDELAWPRRLWQPCP